MWLKRRVLEVLHLAAAKSKRLAVVERLAALREQQQLIRLQQSQATLEQNRLSLERLASYQNEYAQGVGVEKSAVAVNELQNFSCFMNDLSYATELQKQHFDRANDHCQADNAAWSQLHARQRRLQDLVHTARQEEKHRESLKADRENDDRWNALHQTLKAR